MNKPQLAPATGAPPVTVMLIEDNDDRRLIARWETPLFLAPSASYDIDGTTWVVQRINDADTAGGTRQVELYALPIPTVRGGSSPG